MTEKRKLFFILNRLVLGGIAIDIISLAHHLSANWQVTILYGEKEADELEMVSFIEQYPELTFIKISLMRRSIAPLADIFVYRNMYKKIKQHRPHIVHTHGFKSGLLGRLAAKAAGVPVIIHTYHGHLFHSYYNKYISNVIRLVERMLSKISTRILATSTYGAYELSTIYKIAPANKTDTVYIGIEKDNYRYSAAAGQQFRQRYAIPETVIAIAIIGRLVAIKNHSFFVNIVKQLTSTEKEVRFFIIGDGYCKAPIQKELTAKGLTWHEGTSANQQTLVYFTSWITNIAEAIAGIDIVVLTSFNEGTGISLIEAQLFEKPVVATNVGGVRDTLIDGETGFLVDDFNLNDFVKKLQLLIHDKALRIQMGGNGKKFAQDRFSKEKEAAAINRLYNECLALKNAT